MREFTYLHEEQLDEKFEEKFEEFKDSIEISDEVLDDYYTKDEVDDKIGYIEPRLETI